jgi:hypothetical protein
MRELALSMVTVDLILELQRQAETQGRQHGLEDEPLRTRRLLNAIDALSTVEKNELEAVAWLGRGDFEDFESAFRYAGIAAVYGICIHLVEKDSLNFLRRGIEMLPGMSIALA